MLCALQNSSRQNSSLWKLITNSKHLELIHQGLNCPKVHFNNQKVSKNDKSFAGSAFVVLSRAACQLSISHFLSDSSYWSKLLAGEHHASMRSKGCYWFLLVDITATIYHCLVGIYLEEWYVYKMYICLILCHKPFEIHYCFNPMLEN